MLTVFSAATLPMAESTRILLSHPSWKAWEQQMTALTTDIKCTKGLGLSTKDLNPAYPEDKLLSWINYPLSLGGGKKQALPGIFGNSKAQPHIFEGFTFKEREDRPHSCQQFVYQPPCWIQIDIWRGNITLDTLRWRDSNRQ